MTNLFQFPDDVFGIDEVTLYEGEWKSENYAVAGELLDGMGFWEDFSAEISSLRKETSSFSAVEQEMGSFAPKR